MAEINNLEDIKTNFEKITNLINSMRAQGVLSFSGVDKVLTAINSKLDNLGLDENADLIKLLIGEVKTNIEERHGFIVSKFSEVESAINTLVKNDEEALKSTEIKKLFDVIATNLAVFSKEVVAQKDALTEITLRLESLRADDTDKKEIINTISTVKFDITRINNGFESIILNINNNFKELSESFDKLAASNMSDRYGKTIEDIHTTSNTILSAIQMVDRKNTEFNEGLNKLVTIGDFNQAQELLLSLTAKNDEIQSTLSQIADKESVNNLSGVINSSFSDINDKLQSSFAQAADRDSINNLSGVINSSLMAIGDLKQVVINNSDEKSQQLMAQLNYLEDVVRKSTADFDFQQFKSELVNVVNDIGSETNIICNDLLETNTELKRILTAVNLADFTSNLESINNNVLRSESVFKKAIEDISEKVTEENTNSISTITKNFNFQLSELSQKFDLFKDEFSSSDKENTNNIINNISHFAELAHGLNMKIDSGNTKSIEAFNSAITVVKQDLEDFKLTVNGNSREIVTELIEKINGLFSTTADLKTELMLIAENNVGKITSSITGLSEMVSALNSNLAGIPLEFPEKVDEKLAELDKGLKELIAGVVVVNDNNADKILSNIEQVYSSLNSLSEDFKAIYSSDSDKIKSTVENLYSKVNDLNTELPTLLFQSTGRLSDNVANMQVKIDSTNDYLETISNAISNNDVQKMAVDKMEAINADIKFVMENLNATVTQGNNLIYDRVGEITNDIHNLSDALFANLGSTNTEITSRLNAITEILYSIRNDAAKNEQPDENVLEVKSKLEALSNGVNNIAAEVSANINDNNDVWIEKLDIIANNAFEVKSAILSGLHGVNLELTDKLGGLAVEIKDSVTGIAGNVETHTNTITNKLDEVSNDVKTVTNKLANYFINNDSDIVSKISQVGENIALSNNNNSDKINSLHDKTNEISDKLNTINYTLSEKADNVDSNIQTKSEMISEKLDNVSSEIKNVTSEIVKHFLTDNDRSSENADNINKNVDYTRNEVLDKVQTSSEALSGEIEGLKSELGNLTNRIEDTQKISEHTTMLAHKLDNITADVKGVTGELINQIAIDEEEKNEKFRMINNNIDYTKHDLSEQISNNSSQLASLIENLDSSKSEIVDNNNLNTNNLRESFSNTIHMTESNINQRLEEIFDKVNSSKEELSEKIQSNTINENIESVKYDLKVFGERFEQVSADTSSERDSKVQDIHTNINSSRDLILNRLTNVIADNISRVSEQFYVSRTTIEDALKEHFNSNSEEVISTVSQIIETLNSQTDNHTEQTRVIVERIQECLSGFQNAIEASNSVVVNDSKTETERLVSALNNMINEFGSLETELKDTAFTNKSELLNNISGVSSLLNNLSDELHVFIDDNLNEIVNKISQIQNKIDYSEQTILQKIDDTKYESDEKITIINDRLTDIKNKFDMQTEGLHGNINSKFDGLIDRIQDIASSNTSISNENFDNISARLNGLDNILESINQKQESQRSELIEQILVHIDTIKNIAEDSDLKISDSINTIQGMKDESLAILQSSQDVLNNCLKDIKEGSDSQYNHLLTNLETLKQSLASQDSLDEKFNDVEESLINLSKGLNTLNLNNVTQDNLKYFKGEIIDIQNSLKDYISDNSSSKCDMIITELTRYFDNIYEVINNSIQTRIDREEDLIKNSVEMLEGRFNDINTNISGVNESINTIKSIVSSEDKTNRITEQLNSIQSEFQNVDSIKESVEMLGDRFNEVNANIYGVNESVNTIKSIVSSEDKTNRITEQLNSIQSEFQNVDSIKESVEMLGDRFNEVNANIYGVNESVNNIKSIVSSEDKTNKITEQLNNIQSEFQNVDSIKESVEILGDRFNNVNKNISDVNESINTIKSIVSSEDKTNRITEQLNSIQSEFLNINTNIKDIVSENQTGLSGVNADIKRKLAEIETSLNNSVQEKANTLTSLIDNLSASIKELDENIDEDTTRQLNIIKEELSSLSSALFTNTDKLTLASKLHFDEVLEKFTHTEDTINSLNLELNETLSSNISSIKTEFDNLGSLFDRTEEIKSQITNLDNILRSYFENIVDQIQKNSSQDQTDICINKLDAVENKIDKLDFSSQNSENADKIIMSNIETIEQKIDSITSNIDSLTRSTIADEIEEIKNVIFEQKEKIKSLTTTEDLNRLPNIEEINNILQTNTVELLNKFNKKIDDTSVETLLAEEIGKLKSDLLAQTVKILDQISFEVEQAEIIDSIQENSNGLKAEITDFKEDLLAKITANKAEIINAVADKTDIDHIHQKLDDISNNYEILNGIETIQSKLDTVVNDSIEQGLEDIAETVDKGIEDIHSKLDSVVDKSIVKGFEEVKSKLDSVADDTIKKELSDVKSQLETVVNNDELQKEFEAVKKHLITIQSGDSTPDYTYSLQDVESDIAKLRIAMKELQEVAQDEELEDISKKVDDIVMVVDSIKNQISQAEINEIGADVEKMKDDVVSISTRTNKLLLTSENSANLLKENLDSFRLVIDDIDERTRALADSYDLSGVHESISTIERTLRENHHHNNIVNQSLVAIAEWVDCAGSTLSSISERVDRFSDIEEVKSMIRNIEMPDRFDYSVFDTIEEKFSVQQDKIDMLEEKLNRLTELVEANDNSQITKKITSVDKQLSKLNKSIERLTSYVDEE